MMSLSERDQNLTNTPAESTTSYIRARYLNDIKSPVCFFQKHKTTRPAVVNETVTRLIYQESTVTTKYTGKHNMCYRRTYWTTDNGIQRQDKRYNVRPV